MSLSLPVVILSSTHDFLMEGKKKLDFPKFKWDGKSPIEFAIRDYLSRKLKVNLACLLGCDNAQNPLYIALIDEPDFETPKGMSWISPEDIFSQLDLDSKEDKKEKFEISDLDLLKRTYSSYVSSVLNDYDIGHRFSVWSLGESELDSSVLAAMVASGKKTASTSLLVEYTQGDVKLPKVGALSVIVDWSGRVVCVIRTTDVKIDSFDRVDESHAQMEMLGDGSLSYWQDVYWELFDQISKEHNLEADEKMDVVCERFEVLHRF